MLNLGFHQMVKISFFHSYEPFFHISKGKRKLNGTPRDVFPVKRAVSGSKIHPSEKPTELLRMLIGFRTEVGETVLDCFAGSGSTGIAARECNRKAILIEQDPVYHEGICKRLSGETIEVDKDIQEEEE